MFVINLVLSVDNALAISQVVKQISTEKRRKALWIGVAGAIVLRLGITLIIFKLYSIHIVQIIGGTSLIGIAIYGIFKREKKIHYKMGIFQILWLDFLLSIDNLLALTASAHGNLTDILINVLLSVPIVYIVAFGLAKILHRFYYLQYIVALLLVWIGSTMIWRI